MMLLRDQENKINERFCFAKQRNLCRFLFAKNVSHARQENDTIFWEYWMHIFAEFSKPGWKRLQVSRNTVIKLYGES
jgi:hypothetical protein